MWLVAGAACFVPAIVLADPAQRPAGLPELYRGAEFWTRLWSSMWESMALMVLPLTIIVLVSLVTQIENHATTRGSRSTPARSRWGESSSPSWW